MPVPLWTSKAASSEARYNVTTEFPSLGLHSAAATGNVGLVEYALARGQPINSVLDGVLPLHAAAAGGNERVVKLLIEHGADVNAPRLPRRYSNDKNRDASAPIVGTSGSTPLHFAAANGNTNIVTTLLLRGAHANRADKHGITPEMLARQNGWDECAEVLKSWILNKDRDLRERQGPPEADEPVGVPMSRFASRDRDASGSFCDGETSTRRRIHMKRSMDTALSMLKGSSPGSTDALKPPLPSSSTGNLPANTSTMTPPPSPMKPFGEYTFYSNSPSPSPIDPGSRRPSLPQITYPAPPAVNRKTSLATRANPRRPRSAGTDADREADVPRGGAPRKLGSKYSLLNMFKKGQTEASGSGVPLERTGTQSSTLSSSAIPPASALSSSSSVALSQPSAESSPGPPSVNLTDNVAPFMRRPHMSPSTHPQQLPAMQKSPPRPPIPLAVDLHNALAQHQQRDRSGSGASAPFEPGSFIGTALNEGGSPASTSSFTRLGVFRPNNVRDRSGSRGSRGSSAGNRGGSVFDDDFVVTGDAGKSARPGILRAHNRSISGGQGPPGAARALRFDPASGGSGRKGDDSPGRSGSALGLRGSTSAGSLSRLRSETTYERELPDSAPAAVQDFDLEALEKTFLEDEDEDEYAYGRPVPNSRLGIVVDPEPPVLLSDVRPRGLSLTSSSLSSLSPALSTVDADPTIHADFPFSINEPPPIPFDATPGNPPPLDNRGRGASVSSTSTTESQINPLMSASGTTSGSGSMTVTTPPQATEMQLVSPHMSPMPLQRQLDGEDGVQSEPERSPKPPLTPLNERRSHTPLDINLSLISSHAQAEALVQKELQDILEMPVVSPDTKGAGWTPLSARLAAYGESLELERKFRPEVSPVDQDTPTESRPQPPSSRTATSARNNLNVRPGHNGVDRQHSLDTKPTSARRRIREPRRPHTSSGTDSPSTESAPTHHSSRSTSAVSSQTDLRSVPIVVQTAVTAAEVANANYRVRRARTPDPELGLSRVSSLDGMDSVDTELGPTLTRVSTAPISPTRDKRDLARHIASANKLTRMGFTPPQQAKQDAAQTKRFGGLKSLMQTLKGKPV
ncbi:hypothetical protein C8R44DRAFT_128809 [Mycena epipterygia]|nr:hypothetical protein C8R44DRAFT_128809 [Mycena epipterygia]